MKPKLALLLILTVILAADSPVRAEDKTENPSKTVQDVYPGLTSGALSLAVLKDLPEGVLLKAGNTVMASESIAKIIDSQPEEVKEELKKNAFFVLEQEAAGRILLELAQQAIPQSMVEIPKEDNTIIQQFFEQEVFKKIEVTDEELKTFYENNKDMCGGATLEQVGASLKEYLISQKKQEMASGYIQKLGNQVEIQVSDSWVKQQAVLAFDNPVDKARKSKMPSLVDFGASGCRPCDMMAPILETLHKKYEGKLNVIFIHVRQQQILASRYGIQSIPVQVFYDKDGKEVFRHEGFFPQEEIEKKLKEIGVQ
jgi:thiol-disulfide isomerase/thioredoxin